MAFNQQKHPKWGDDANVKYNGIVETTMKKNILNHGCATGIQYYDIFEGRIAIFTRTRN